MQEQVLWKNKQDWQTFNQIHQEKERDDTNNKIRNEIEEVTTDITEKQRTVVEFYEQLNANKLDHLGKMDKLLEIYNLPN